MKTLFSTLLLISFCIACVPIRYREVETKLFVYQVSFGAEARFPLIPENVIRGSKYVHLWGNCRDTLTVDRKKIEQLIRRNRMYRPRISATKDIRYVGIFPSNDTILISTYKIGTYKGKHFKLSRELSRILVLHPNTNLPTRYRLPDEEK